MKAAAVLSFTGCLRNSGNLIRPVLYTTKASCTTALTTTVPTWNHRCILQRQTWKSSWRRILRSHSSCASIPIPWAIRTAACTSISNCLREIRGIRAGLSGTLWTRQFSGRTVTAKSILPTAVTAANVRPIMSSPETGSSTRSGDLTGRYRRSGIITARSRQMYLRTVSELRTKTYLSIQTLLTASSWCSRRDGSLRKLQWKYLCSRLRKQYSAFRTVSSKR